MDMDKEPMTPVKDAERQERLSGWSTAFTLLPATMHTPLCGRERSRNEVMLATQRADERGKEQSVWWLAAATHHAPQNLISDGIPSLTSSPCIRLQWLVVLPLSICFPQCPSQGGLLLHFRVNDQTAGER